MVLNVSSWLKEIFEKYGDDFVLNGKNILPSGKFWELQWKLSLAIIYHKENVENVFYELGTSFGDIGNLEEVSSEVREEIDFIVSEFLDKFQEFNGRYYFEYSDTKFGITSIVSNVISNKFVNKSVVLLKIEKEICKVSLRNQESKEDMNLLIRKLLEGFENSRGGGHIPAAGGHFPKKYLGEFKNRLENLSSAPIR